MSFTPSHYDPNDPPVCTACERAPFSHGGRFVHITGDRHPVVEVKPASQVPGAILRCDFCSGEPSLWVYTFEAVRTDEQLIVERVHVKVSDHQRRNYNAKPSRYETGEVDALDWGHHWFTCGPCAELIEANDLMALVGRVVDELAPKLKRGNRLPAVRGEVRRTYEPMLAAPFTRKALQGKRVAAPTVPLASGTVGGMQKITLSLPEHSDKMARERAERAGVTISAWVDRAIRKFAADEDVAVYEAWSETWSDEDKAIEAALMQADREALERGE